MQALMAKWLSVAAAWMRSSFTKACRQQQKTFCCAHLLMGQRGKDTNLQD
jgi:hypothetical protein